MCYEQVGEYAWTQSLICFYLLSAVDADQQKSRIDACLSCCNYDVIQTTIAVVQKFTSSAHFCLPGMYSIHVG